MPSLSRSPSKEDHPDATARREGSSAARLAAAGSANVGAAELEVYRGDLLRRARTLTYGDASKAHDLVQDTMERALRNLHRLVAGSNVRAWLYTILVRRFQDVLRYERVHRTSSLDESPEPACVDLERPPAWNAITTEQVRAALGKLSAELRRAFELREFARLSYQAIAQETGVPVATVGTRVMRARLRLRSILLSKLDLEEEEGK